MILCDFKHLIGKKIVRISEEEYKFNFASSFLNLETYSEKFVLSYNSFETDKILINPLSLIGIIGQTIKDVFMINKEKEVELHIITNTENILTVKNVGKIMIHIE